MHKVKGCSLCHRISHGTNKYITEDNHSRGGLFIIHQPSCSTANIPNGLLSTLNLKKLTRSQQAHTSLHCNSPSLSTFILLHCIWVLYLTSDPVKRVQWMPDDACLVVLICRITQQIFEYLKENNQAFFKLSNLLNLLLTTVSVQP